MNVRLATDADIPEIVRMGRLFWSQTPYCEIPYCPDSVAFTARQMIGVNLLLIATVDGEVAGSVGAMPSPLYANRDVLIACELWWWVEPQHRDSGIGKLMLSEIEVAARNAGVRWFAMMAFEDLQLEKAAAVYQKYGYRATERTYGKVL